MNNRFMLKPIKRVATINDEALSETTDPDFELQYIDIGNVDSNGNVHEVANYRFENAPSRARRIVRDGDVIISTVRTYLQAITAIANPPENLIVSTGFAVVRPSAGKLDVGFCKYALREPRFLQEVITRSTGVSYPAITSLDLADIPIFVPPLPEQRAIADYLDRETARLDSLIAAKERLLELLAEKRRAVITHAVTRGLNADVPLRDSGVEWLDKVPTHWSGSMLKRWVETKITDGPHETPENVENGIPFVSAEACQNGRINFDSRWGNISRETHERYSKKLLPRRNDIFLVKSGATTGKVAYVDTDIEFNVWSPLALVRANTKMILPEFLFVTMQSDYFQKQIQMTWSAGTQPNISMGTIEELYVVAPSVDEQKNILKKLDVQLKNIDRLSILANKTIEHLHERRAALIAAAVSGQIKVV